MESLDGLDYLLQLTKNTRHCEFRNYFQEYCDEIFNRLQAVQSIKKSILMYGLSYETRDLSIQIFDSFLMETLRRNSKQILFENNIDFTMYAAVTSMIIASKLLESSPLLMATFQQFSHDDLRVFERHFLQVLNFDISPLTTPIYLARYFLAKWSKYSENIDFIENVGHLIGRFWEVPESISFSPVVVAISAVLICLSDEGKDTASFLASVPSCFIEQPLPIDSSFEDIDCCLQIFSHVTDLRMKKSELYEKELSQLSSTDVTMEATAGDHTIVEKKSKKRTRSPLDITATHEDVSLGRSFQRIE